MDKKNMTLGVLLLMAAFAAMLYNQAHTPPAQPAREIARTTGPNAAAPNATSTTPGASESTPAAPAGPSLGAAFVAVEKEDASAKVTTIGNDFIEVRLTDFGGAISNVAFKKYDAVKSVPGVPFIFNEQHGDPALAFVDFKGLDRNTRYDLVSATANEVVYRALFEDRIEVTRRYTLMQPGDAKGDPYQLHHETTFRNLKAETASLPAVALSLGTAAPVSARDYGLYLATGHDINGDVSFTKRSALEGTGFFGIGARGPIPSIESGGPVLWGSVSNQFFTGILTPEKPAKGVATRRVELPALPGATAPSIGVTGSVEFDGPALPPNGSTKIAADYYAGPKEYSRLSNTEVFKVDQHKVMQFGFFKWFSQLLLTIMTWMHSWTGNWGVAIILTTLSLKVIFLYPTISASKSAKRMQKVQPELTALKEKYKDNPQKLQTETMEVFKKHRVNPVGGCIPILITMPFFMGFYSMLQSTAELRFAEFLWAKDLSSSDTVALIFGFPLNIMPLLMGTTMIIQMRLVPQPTVDNAQAKMIKFMPWIFIFFCYTFSCALSLYSFVNGLFTICQQLVINRMKDDPPAPVAAGNRTLKNVTPKKKA